MIPNDAFFDFVSEELYEMYFDMLIESAVKAMNDAKVINEKLWDEKTQFYYDLKNDDTFNFAFDVVDEMARKAPSKTAMIHVTNDKKSRRFS